MIKKITLSIILLLILTLSGCFSIYGGIYQVNDEIGSKQGVSCGLGFSIARAAKNGGITKVATSAYRTNGCIVVTGD